VGQAVIPDILTRAGSSEKARGPQIGSEYAEPDCFTDAVTGPAHRIRVARPISAAATWCTTGVSTTCSAPSGCPVRVRIGAVTEATRQALEPRAAELRDKDSPLKLTPLSATRLLPVSPSTASFVQTSFRVETWDLHFNHLFGWINDHSKETTSQPGTGIPRSHRSARQTSR
jgi:hypothetical protein